MERSYVSGFSPYQLWNGGSAPPQFGILAVSFLLIFAFGMISMKIFETHTIKIYYKEEHEEFFLEFLVHTRLQRLEFFSEFFLRAIFHE